MAVLCQIDAVVGKFRSLVVEAVFMDHNPLHRRHLNLVGDGQVVDAVADLVILHHENPVLGSVQVQTTRLVHNGRLRDVTVAMRVEIIHGHGVALGVSQAVPSFIATDGWINSEREQMLVVLSQNAIMNHSAPRSRFAGVDGSSGQDAGGANFVVHFTSLVEDVSKYIPKSKC